MSDAANWSRVRELFSRALDLDPPLRAAFLRQACGGDAVLHAEVSSLLAAHADAGSVAEGSPLAALDASAVQSLMHGLRAGDRLGPYDIVGPLGAGGMGEVFEARDSVLGRRVAIKILSADLALDGSARDRLVREAKALASLNHHGIAQIHGLEESNGMSALVMELVEGDDLSMRVARGPIRIDQALSIARQIAEALEAAHEKGIIHRDLKPANIKIRPDGSVKVLDFGLAKIRDQGSGIGDQGRTASIHATEAGVILGTPAYMSPEQVRGEEVDTRTDVWALGCVLFELLTGNRTFGGSTSSDCIAAVLEREPDWSALPQATPQSIRILLRRCLQKDRAKRLRDVGDARFALEDAALAPEPVGKVQPGKRPLVTLGLLGVTAAALAALAVPAVRHLRETPPPAPPEIRLDIVTPATDRPRSFALSPDGKQIVYVAPGDGGSLLWLRSLATTTAQPLAGTEGAASPFWSPDSRSIGFFANSKLMRIDIGGASRPLADVSVGQGGTWNADGVIVFAPNQVGGLRRVSATGGGAVSEVTRLGPQHRGQWGPYFLPDGRRFLFFVSAVGDAGGIHLGSLDGEAPRRLTPAAGVGVYLPSGWLLWVRPGTETLVAQRLDIESATLTGETVTVADGISSSGGSEGVLGVSVAANGLMAYRWAKGQRQLTWFDRSGTARGTVGDPDNLLSEPRVSPDGGRVAMSRSIQGNQDVWLLDGSRMSRLTFDAAVDARPVWSPDGTRIVFRSNRAGPGDLYVTRTNGAGSEEPLVTSDRVKNPMSWSKNGRFLLYRNSDLQTGDDLLVVPMTGDRTPFVFLKTPSREAHGMFSPDGQWVVYQSAESGKPEIFVRPFVPPGQKGTTAGGQWQVSSGGGINPVWAPDGKEVYYLNPAGGMMAATITVSGSTLEPGAPVLLFQTRIVGGGADLFQGRHYDVAPDGRFLINTELDTGAVPITLLMNWNPETKR